MTGIGMYGTKQAQHMIVQGQTETAADLSLRRQTGLLTDYGHTTER